MIVFNTILSEAVLQPLSKRVDFALGLSQRVTILVALFLAFLCLESPVTSSEDAPDPCTSLRPLTPEREQFIHGKPGGLSSDHLHP